MTYFFHLQLSLFLSQEPSLNPNPCYHHYFVVYISQGKEDCNLGFFLVSMIKFREGCEITCFSVNDEGCCHNIHV